MTYSDFPVARSVRASHISAGGGDHDIHTAHRLTDCQIGSGGVDQSSRTAHAALDSQFLNGGAGIDLLHIHRRVDSHGLSGVQHLLGHHPAPMRNAKLRSVVASTSAPPILFTAASDSVAVRHSLQYTQRRYASHPPRGVLHQRTPTPTCCSLAMTCAVWGITSRVVS